MFRSLRSLSLTAGLVALSACAGEDDDTAAALEAAQVDMSAALEAALAELPGAFPLEVDLELQNAKPVYEVELLNDGQVLLVLIDGVTGKASGRSQLKPDDEERRVLDALEAVPVGARTSLADALSEATRKVDQGRPVEVDLELDAQRRPVYVIGLLRGDSEEEVEVLIGEASDR